MSVLLEHAIIPSEEDRLNASESSSQLERLLQEAERIHIRVARDQMPDVTLSIPEPALQLLSEILKEMARGNTVTLVPIHAMLSTQEAADILNVSRPFLVGLLEAGKIPYQRLGTHRRIQFRDLMAFKVKTDAAREEAFRQLTEDAQELGLGY